MKLSMEQYHYKLTRISNADMHLKRLCVDLTWIFCSFGLIFGRSGSGKTTLLQVFLLILSFVFKFILVFLASNLQKVLCSGWFLSLTFSMQLIAGLSKPTSGSIYVQRYSDDGEQIKSPELLQPEKVGIVFQFPERYSFLDHVFHTLSWCSLRHNAILMLRFILNIMHFHLLFLLKRQKLLQLSIYSRCRLYESSALQLSKHYLLTSQFWYYLHKYIFIYLHTYW